MLQKDFNMLQEVGTIMEFDDADLRELEYANILLLIQDDMVEDLSDLTEDDLVDNIVGYSQADTIAVGQMFENPYDKNSYFKVVEVDESRQRALIAKIDNE